jgi:hypothetical protein
MIERKDVPIGIVLFLIFIIVLDIVFFFYLANSLMVVNGDITSFFLFSISSIVMWIDVLLVTLSLIIIPYGFAKRKNWARIYALVFLSWSVFRMVTYISMTGEKMIGFLLFVMFVISIIYLLMSSVKRYFGKISMAIVPVEILKEYTYGLYTLYSKLVRLKNGKNQIIYFFSKRTPKSGTPTTFPDGFQVEVSKRSGLPYLKKRDDLSLNINTIS